jgi:hypothetical protein
MLWTELIWLRIGSSDRTLLNTRTEFLAPKNIGKFLPCLATGSSFKDSVPWSQRMSSSIWIRCVGRQMVFSLSLSGVCIREYKMTLLKITVDMFKTTELSYFPSQPAGLRTPIYHSPSVITSLCSAGLPEITMNNVCKVESRTCGKQILNLNNTKEATNHLKAKSDSRSISFPATGSFNGTGRSVLGRRIWNGERSEAKPCAYERVGFNNEIVTVIRLSLRQKQTWRWFGHNSNG